MKGLFPVSLLEVTSLSVPLCLSREILADGPETRFIVDVKAEADGARAELEEVRISSEVSQNPVRTRWPCSAVPGKPEPRLLFRSTC